MAGQAGEEVFDVVVVGGGGSGLAAAIEARLKGRAVLLVEKNAELGGSTAMSIGSITASTTPHQKRRGIQDRPEDHFVDMPLFAGELAARDNDQLRRILCDEAPQTFRWLLELGVRFSGPTLEPPHRRPRMHNVLPNARSYIYHLERRARCDGVQIELDMRAERLLHDQGGVTGVQCRGRDGRARRFVARRGVILAAGDFTSSLELKGRYMGPRQAAVEGVNPTATGDGQRMALALGARILNGDLALGPEIRFIPPVRAALARRLPPWRLLGASMQWALDHLPTVLLRPLLMSFLTTVLAPSPALFANGAILVNGRGERFCNELDEPAYALAQQPQKTGYIVIDGRLARLFSAWPNYVSTAPGVAYAYIPDYRRNRRDVFTEAASLADLTRKLGMPPASLEQAGAQPKASGTPGASQDGGPRPALQEPPFIALGPVRAVMVLNEGGLAVDTRHRVLDGNGQPITGLYAAGSTGQGGLLLNGHGHHLAWAFVSGRRAGRFAAGETSSDGQAVLR